MSTQKYFLELPHKPIDCARAIKLVSINGYITMFQWGCNAGNHTAVAIIDAENEKEVLNILPPLLRPNARIVKLNTYSPAEIRKIHKLADAQESSN